ncbi:Exocyst complex component SEC6 [Picochlorum sp. SENEW3]|nr:Exocyst complex component SEC6 [Picochlorum sp. SENEW3]
MSSITTQAIEAREKAAQRLKGLLATSDDLARLPSLKEDNEVEKTSAQRQLRAVFGANTEHILSGLESLKRAHAALVKFDAVFSQMSTICSKSIEAIETDDTLRRLATMHSNISETLQSTETVAGLPEAALKAENMLQDSDTAVGLIESHAYLSQVEGTVHRVKTTLELLQDRQSYQLPSLETYFVQVNNAMAKIEYRLWSIVRSFISLGNSRPEILVSALRVIETQEVVDAKLLADGMGDSPLRKGWRRRCIQNMSASIAESFSDILQRCSKLLSSESNSGRLLRSILSDAHEKLVQVHASTNRLIPCFPPVYHVEDFLWHEYRGQTDNILEIIGAISTQLSNNDILFTLDWIQRHDQYLLQDGSGIEQMRGVDALLETYVHRMDEALRNWLKNIMNADFKGEPSHDGDGRLYTPGPQDMFRLIEEQLTAAETGGAVLLEKVVSVMEGIVQDYASQYESRIASDSNALEVLCAVGNNCLRICNLISDLNEMINTVLKSRETEGFTKSLQSHFKLIAKQSSEMCGQVVFMDPGFGELFSLLCHSDDWKRGITTGSMLATLDDFLSDFKIWLDEFLLNVLATSMLIECVSYYMAALLSQTRHVNTETLSFLKRDTDAIREYFNRYLPSDVVENECQILADVGDFLASDSVEAFVLSYSALLEQAPLSPMLLVGILNARVASQHDMTKADAREVLASCRETFGDRSSVAKFSTRQSVNPSMKNSAFISALNAIRQRH